MKKRIFAASMASVMALSSVSVVAFADETKADFGETVTKAELKEAIKQYDETLKNIDSYGSVQALRFQEAYDHAALVASDADADETAATAAYQMLKAVASKLQQHTNAELKELVEDNKDIYERNNVLNEEIMDCIYKEEDFLKFKNAYEEAEAVVDVDDLMLVTDAYIALDEAAANLELNKLTPVLKTEYRAIIKEYESMLAQFGKTESWRRGKVSVKPTTGAPQNAAKEDLDLTTATYVTWGELKEIVNGTSVSDVVVGVNDNADADDVMTPSASTWIAVGATNKTVEELIYDQSKSFDDYKAASRTTDPTIKSGYEAAKEAIAVFKSWKAIDNDSTVKSQASKTLNKYRIQLANDFEQTLINSLVPTTPTVADVATGLAFEEKDSTGNTTYKAALEYDGDKLVGVAGAAKAGCVLRIVSSTGLIQLDSDDPNAQSTAKGDYVHGDIAGVKSYTIKIIEGEDYMKYIPVRSDNVTTNTTYTKDDAGKIARVAAALKMLETYNDVAKKSKPTDTDWDGAYGTKNNQANDPIDDVYDLDENRTVTKAAGTSKEYTFINRYLTYALQDLYPEQAEGCKHTRKDIEALINKAYDLIDETGNSNIFAKANEELAQARKNAVEWVRESKKDLKYKDNDADHGMFDLAGTPENATTVYHTLSDAPGAKYDALESMLAQYPISYGEIAEKIADVNGDIDDGVYGEKVKLAVDDVAYALSVLKAADEGNEAFDDERAFNGYNRLFVDSDNSTDEEKNLKAALDALDEAIKAGDVGDVVMGDVDGDGIANAKDALMVLQAAAGSVELTSAQTKAADFNGDGVISAKDALAILKAAAGVKE